MRTRFTEPLVLALTLLLACAASTAFAANIADVQIEPSAVVFKPSGDLERGEFSLSVSAPDECVFEFRFREGEEIVFENRSPHGGELEDGQYSYQLTHLPILSQKDRDTLAKARINDDMLEKKRLKEMGVIRRTLAQSGFFSVDRGQFVYEDLKEEEGVKKGLEALADVERLDRASSVDGAGLVGSAEEYTISGDLTVYNSMCVGFDCLANETYGADTIRLKENNLRIHFEDTSTAAGFPSNDWRIVANAQASGGANKFSIDDVSANRTPFTIEAGAVNNALYVDNGGRVGVATPNPVLEMHLNNGDTPGLRLQQNSSSGFGAQTWDVAGNETSFFVRDATNGSTLPFRIFPNAPSSSLIVEGTTGNIGLGTTSPSSSLHVLEGSSESAQLRVQDTGGDAILDIMELQNAGEVRFAIEDTSAANRRWEFRTAGPNFQFTRDTAPAADLLIDTAGNLTVRGNLVTGGGGLCDPGPCDGTFTHYELESIEEHAEYMWENHHLWGVGPTPEGEPINLSKKTTGILHELEKAHIYIEQLNERISALEEALAGKPSDE